MTVPATEAVASVDYEREEVTWESCCLLISLSVRNLILSVEEVPFPSTDIPNSEYLWCKSEEVVTDTEYLEIAYHQLKSKQKWCDRGRSGDVPRTNYTGCSTLWPVILAIFSLPVSTFCDIPPAVPLSEHSLCLSSHSSHFAWWYLKLKSVHFCRLWYVLKWCLTAVEMRNTTTHLVINLSDPLMACDDISAIEALISAEALLWQKSL